MYIQCPSKYTRKVLGLLNEFIFRQGSQRQNLIPIETKSRFFQPFLSPVTVGNKCHANK